MKVLLVLSECPASQSSGGAAAGHDRVLLLSEMVHLGVAYIDWNNDSPDLSALGAPSWGIKPRLPGAKRLVRLLRRVQWLASGKPWFFSGFDQRSVADRITAIANEFRPDLICFDNIPGTIVWDACRNFRRVYFAHNVEHEVVAYSSGASMFISSSQKKRMLRHELSVIAQADAVVFFTEKDRKALLGEAAGKLVDVVLPAFAEPLASVASLAESDYVILPTNAGWKANKLSLDWFFSNVYPLVSTSIRFIITGRDDDGFLADIADRHAGVTYKGLLNRQEYEGLFIGAKLFVNPTMHGSGFQIKMMEAIRFGVPVISTDFSNHVGPEVASSDSPEILACMINKFMCDGGSVRKADYSSLHAQTKSKLSEVMRHVYEIR